MASLLSDQHAMDPEVLVSLWPTRGSHSLYRALWSSLARSWGVAIFLIIGLGVAQWGCTVSLISLCLAAMTVYLKEYCSGCHSTSVGTWLSILHNSCVLAAVAVGLSATLDHMVADKGRLWVDQHINKAAPDLIALVVIAIITLLFILGLERSTILRAILIISVCSSIIIFLTLGMTLVDKTLVKQLYQTPDSVSQVLQATSYFTCCFSGVSTKILTVAKEPSCIVVVIALTTTSYIIVNVFLSLLVEQQMLNEGIYFIRIFEIRDVWWGREIMAILAIICLSLSLPEIVAVTQKSITNVAGNIIPSAMAREFLLTNTQVYTILLSGFISSLLVCSCSLRNLFLLSSTSFLLSHVVDVLSTLYQQYQPVIVPKISSGGYATNDRRYKLLLQDSDDLQSMLGQPTSALFDSSDDERHSLSDDSGHSSDTDIDAIVAEYKEKIKVVTTLAEPITVEPTLLSGRKVTFCLVGVVVSSLITGFTLAYNYYWVTAVSVLAETVLLAIINSQPKIQETPSNKPTSPWLPSLTLTINVILICNVLFRVGIVLTLWLITGALASCYTKRTCNLRHLKRRKERIKLCVPPSHHTVTSYLSRYRKMTHVDTVHISR